VKYWWVSQNKTFKHEFYGGYMWSPKQNNNGARNQYYENMRLVQPGDVVFSYAKSQIQGVGVATSQAMTSPKPSEFGTAGDDWDSTGWHVQVSFAPLLAPFDVKNHMNQLVDVLPSIHGPLQPNGRANQRYLTVVPDLMAKRLVMLLGEDFHNTFLLAGGNLAENDAQANLMEQELEQRLDLKLLEKHQLIKARRGQGIFKTNVRLIEKECRVTKLALHQHLIASHIKPWADSDDREKLDGNNGLLLSPHVDHLFDRGYMSMKNNGEVIWSQKLQYRVLSSWRLDFDINVGSFNSEQKRYLEFHRDVRLLAG
jgi:putative restriction endonuclease